MNVHFRACVQSVHQPACTHDLRRSRHWSVVTSIMSWSKSNQVCVKSFYRSSTSWMVSHMHCCITPQIN